MTIIELLASDSVIVKADMDVVKTFGTFIKMFENCGTFNPNVPIPVEKVASPILTLVIEWSEHHLNNPVNVPTPTVIKSPNPYLSTVKTMADLTISAWDLQFMNKLNQCMQYELLVAANYLDIKNLFVLACKSIAKLIINKTPQEIRQTFNITDS